MAGYRLEKTYFLKSSTVMNFTQCPRLSLLDLNFHQKNVRTGLVLLCDQPHTPSQCHLDRKDARFLPDSNTLIFLLCLPRDFVVKFSEKRSAQEEEEDFRLKVPEPITFFSSRQ